MVLSVRRTDPGQLIPVRRQESRPGAEGRGGEEQRPDGANAHLASSYTYMLLLAPSCFKMLMSHGHIGTLEAEDGTRSGPSRRPRRPQQKSSLVEFWSRKSHRDGRRRKCPQFYIATQPGRRDEDSDQARNTPEGTISSALPQSTETTQRCPLPFPPSPSNLPKNESPSNLRDRSLSGPGRQRDGSIVGARHDVGKYVWWDGAWGRRRSGQRACGGENNAIEC